MKPSSRNYSGYVEILSSGGIDSTALIHYYLSKGFNVVARFIDYGQLSRHIERKTVKMICSYYKVKLKTITVKGGVELSFGEIVGRNSLLLDMALMNFREKNGLVSIGIHSGTDYLDCSKSFIDMMQDIYDLYSNGRIIIDTPFIYWTKDEIIQYCIEYQIPLHLCYSCESGQDQPCNQCESCKYLLKRMPLWRHSQEVQH